MASLEKAASITRDGKQIPPHKILLRLAILQKYQLENHQRPASGPGSASIVSPRRRRKAAKKPQKCDSTEVASDLTNGSSLRKRQKIDNQQRPQLQLSNESENWSDVMNPCTMSVPQVPKDFSAKPAVCTNDDARRLLEQICGHASEDEAPSTPVETCSKNMQENTVSPTSVSRLCLPSNSTVQCDSKGWLVNGRFLARRQVVPVQKQLEIAQDFYDRVCCEQFYESLCASLLEGQNMT